MDINKINIALIQGLKNEDIQLYNDLGWNQVAKISKNHPVGSRTEIINIIIDEMYKNSISEKPKKIN